MGRADLQEIAAGLLDLHRALLAEQRAAYERTRGPIVGGAQLLHLTIHDPAFAWLRVLSALATDLDELLEQPEPPSDEESGAVRAELEETFSPRAPDDFWSRCAPLLQVPPVAMAYARVRAALSRLPPPIPPDTAAELHAKHRWAVARRMRGSGGV
jgi:hypothetical protein